MTPAQKSDDWGMRSSLYELLVKAGRAYSDYLDELAIYDGASFGGKRVDALLDELLALFNAGLERKVVEARIDELATLPEWGDYNDPYRQEIRYRLAQLRADRGDDA